MWKELKTDIFIDLEKTLFCGQIFHFKKVNQNIFVGSSYGIPLILKQEGQSVYFFEIHKDNEKVISRLFNLDIILPDYLKSDGLRFVTNDFHSAVFSFICSSNNNLKRITKMIDFLYSLGDQLCFELDDNEMIEILKDVKIYKFPCLEKLVSIENILIINKFGYRSKYICDAARFLLIIMILIGFH